MNWAATRLAHSQDPILSVRSYFSFKTGFSASVTAVETSISEAARIRRRVKRRDFFLR